jgi:hypothetical protein
MAERNSWLLELGSESGTQGSTSGGQMRWEDGDFDEWLWDGGMVVGGAVILVLWIWSVIPHGTS